jgi:hypothetical protein
MTPATCSTEGSEATVGVLDPGYRGMPVMAQTNLDTAPFPRTANGWRTKYLVLDRIPPLLVHGEGPPT